MRIGASLLISVTFSEAILKGANRYHIENLTIKNLLFGLTPFGKFKVQKKASRILLASDDFDREKVKSAALKVFGIDYISFPISVAPNIKEIENAVLENSSDLVGHTICVETKRSDKSFPMKSQEINAAVGAVLVKKGCKVDLENPEKIIYVDVIPGEVLICFDKFKGFGGMPVGSSGKVLSLLSGGIDSPVSSLLMMKRGCMVDLLHLHSFPSNNHAKKSKIIQLANRIREFSPVKQKLFLVPYEEFYKATLKIDSKIELVIFRRFILHLVNRLARKYKYKGAVTGDSLGQVASQTLDNLFATDEAAQLPVFRPLISFNKQEIVDLAKKVGTFEISIQPYKDCCSLVATKSPSTNVWLDDAKKVEKEIDMDSIVDKTIEQIEIVEI
ncbi:tRNA sulfurtransferase [Candidatus Bilamarchaeum dharawalense]|uniref:Probable tRNA sulfurtransferase n=1 Tax=Candidatus Bilamarchaeum dharawalense TaxID=2885759 RepID=A0A5E4LNC6_9ARCH|nr:tRNA sulfurtransferase [Candidatus Bilamarchaeum dharawalense]